MSKDPGVSKERRARLAISDAERCSYIADMCLELRELAPRTRLRDLNYLLDLARAEAEHMAKTLLEGNGRH